MMNRFTIYITVLLVIACTPNAKLTQGQYYSPRARSLNMSFPGQTKDNLEYDQFGGLTKRTYRRHIENIASNLNDKLLYYSHVVDLPGNTPYTLMGKLVAKVDTAKMKDQGFVNRQMENMPYLKKVYDDRGKQVVTAEYMVKLDSGYFYLLGYAPTGRRRFKFNYEDVIIAQDSLDRKLSAIIKSFRRK